MTMSRIWTGMLTAAVCCALWTGRGAEVARAAMEGAQAGLELCISIGGMLCLWSGVMEVMERCGLAERLARLMGPVLRLIFREGDERSHFRQHFRQSAGAGQCRYAVGAEGYFQAGPHGEGTRTGLRRNVQAGGVQCRLAAADPHDGGSGTSCGGM